MEKGNTLIVIKYPTQPTSFTSNGLAINDVRVVALEDPMGRDRLRGWRFTKIVFLCEATRAQENEILSHLLDVKPNPVQVGNENLLDKEEY